MPTWRAHNTLFWITTIAFSASAATAVTAAVVVVPNALRDRNFVALLVPAPTGTPVVPAALPPPDTMDWTTYRSNDVPGVRFKYPLVGEPYVPIAGGTGSLQFGSTVWKMADATLNENHQPLPYHQVFKLVAASPGRDKHEPCCGFSGPPIDLAQADAALAAEISTAMGPIAGIQRLTVGNRPVVAFMHGEWRDLDGTTTVWVTRSYLLPYPQAGYTNLLVSGPALAVKMVPTDAGKVEPATTQLLEQVSGDWQPPDADIQRRLKIFETMVSTIEFTVP